MRFDHELAALSGWCSRRHLHWSLRDETGNTAVLLEPEQPANPWERVVVVLGDNDMWLENAKGERLASASGLPALLDALDGGVQEPLDHSNVA